MVPSLQGFAIKILCAFLMSLMRAYVFIILKSRKYYFMALYDSRTESNERIYPTKKQRYTYNNK
jgi:uncharacterized membrane protein